MGRGLGRRRSPLDCGRPRGLTGGLHTAGIEKVVVAQYLRVHASALFVLYRRRTGCNACVAPVEEEPALSWARSCCWARSGRRVHNGLELFFLRSSYPRNCVVDVVVVVLIGVVVVLVAGACVVVVVRTTVVGTALVVVVVVEVVVVVDALIVVVDALVVVVKLFVVGLTMGNCPASLLAVSPDSGFLSRFHHSYSLPDVLDFTGAALVLDGQPYSPGCWAQYAFTVIPAAQARQVGVMALQHALGGGVVAQLCNLQDCTCCSSGGHGSPSRAGRNLTTRRAAAYPIHSYEHTVHADHCAATVDLLRLGRCLGTSGAAVDGSTAPAQAATFHAMSYSRNGAAPKVRG